MHVNISIVGLDRLSLSFAQALKRYQSQPKAEHSFTIIGNDMRGHVMKTAEKMGALDNFDRKLHKATENADLILVNAPLNQHEDTYARLGQNIKPGAVVLDMTVLKQSAIDRVYKYFPKNAQGELMAYLVGITPIVNAKGLYESNWEAEAATPDLFDNAEVLIAPDTKCPSEAIALAEDIVRLIGAKPRFIDPAEHDGLVAATEELPNLLGLVLFNMLQQSGGWMELRRMVNPTLALAIQNLRYQNPQDLLALFSQNRGNLVRHLDNMIGALSEARGILNEAPDEDGEFIKLEAYLQQTGKEWEKWDTKRFSGQWDDAKQVDTSTVGLFGNMGSMFNLKSRSDNDDN